MDNSTPKYLLVEEHIKQQIKSRNLVKKLPGERSLARELGYSYMTIRKAIENLVNEGILYRIPTKGTYVADRKTRRSKTKTIGYFLDNRITSGISSPYYSLIFNALEKTAAKNGFALVYCTDADEKNLFKTIGKLDGMVASCFTRVEPLIQEIKELVPVVVIDNSASDKSIPSVIIDNFTALVDTVDYLCSLGHKQIGFMTGLEDSDVGRNRYAGYRSGLSRHGITADDQLVFRGNYSFDSGIQGANYFLSMDKLPSAIVCANDSMALGAISQFGRAGYSVPHAISIVGFDDIEVASQIVPALTTVAAPVEKIAECAFAALNSLMEGKEPENAHIACHQDSYPDNRRPNPTAMWLLRKYA